MHVDVVLEGGSSDATGVLEVRNPADHREVVGTVPNLEPHHVDRAVESAALAQGAWGALSAADRAVQLVATSDAVGVLSGLEDLLIREQGKVRWEAAFELGFFEATAHVMTELAPFIDDPQVLLDDGMGVAHLHQDPVGVVGIITPWNYPFAIPAIKLLPALLAGNAVVLVLPPTAPLTALTAYRAMADLLPPGLLSVITGAGPKVGQRLVEHPDVAKVSFTGSTATGRLIATAAADSLKGLVLELGGNDAAVVAEDCVLDDAFFETIISGSFTTTGQVCFAIKRLYVPERRVDQVVEGLVASLGDTIVGNGMDDEVTMGPLHNRMQRDKVQGLVDLAREAGATVHECGALRGDPDVGWFMRPSIVSGVDNRQSIVQQEQFGPTLPVLGYRDLDHAIAMANDTEYGLCSSIWTADEEWGRGVARRLHAGSTFINSHGLFSVDPRVPFGGVKHSGLGRELGLLGLSAMCEPHVVSTRHL